MVAAVDEAIRSKLDASRKDLLDLGMRNSLLNFRPSKVRGVEVVDEMSAEVYRVLVQEGKSLTFLPSKEIVEEADEYEGAPQTGKESGAMPDGGVEVGTHLGQPGDEEAGRAAARHRDTKLQTGLNSEQLQARLLKTYLTARTHLEEQGVNVLFLALGFLKWYEAEQSNDARRAPLLLVPVRLERSDALDKFHLVYTGEEVGDNLSLATKLKSEFAVSLPPLPPADDLSVSDYLSAAQAAMKRQPRWSVEENAITLGFFSFGKFLMYKDLDDESWPEGAGPVSHPLVRALLDEGLREEASPISEYDHLDQYLSPNEVHTVMDADSTQTLAILDVNRGRNLVIQGPPGTGKSQTITNLVAEALGHGKKVLFVSEKMAALEVVKRRLDNIGLGDACLELHSHKTNKKGVLLELERTLELGKPRLEEGTSDLASLEQARDRLNAYAEAVNTSIAETSITPYRAYGSLLLLQKEHVGREPVELDIPDVGKWSEVEFTQRRNLVQELERHLEELGPPREHPFWGSRMTAFLPTEQNKLRDAIAKARGSTQVLAELSGQLAAQLGLGSADNSAEARTLMAAAERALDAPDLSTMPLRAELWRGRADNLQSVLTSGARFTELHAQYDAMLKAEPWELELKEVRQTLHQQGRKWWRFLSSAYRSAKERMTALFMETPPTSLDEQLGVIDAILEAQGHRAVLEELGDVGVELFGRHWQGEQSDWAALTLKRDWLSALFGDVKAARTPEGLITYLASDPNVDKLGELSRSVRGSLDEHHVNVERVLHLLEYPTDWALDDGTMLTTAPFQAQDKLLARWAENVAGVFAFATYNNMVEQCRKLGLEAVVRAVDSAGFSPQGNANALASAVEQAWLSALLAHAYSQRPILGQFSRISHEQTRDTFKRLDEFLIDFNRAKLAAFHWRGLPSPDAGGQLLVLRREIEKKKRHLPIRQLLSKAGSIIQTIKPVFMMSPLSIATFLSQDGPRFDLVIFDEASQVRPVEALGAILRGKQVVVVGDSKQLPPTSFFDTLLTAEDLDEDNTTGDLESVLGLFTAQGAPQRMLRWHYRSKHESLIAVSNHEFYNDKLVVFPSPDTQRGDVGLVYHYLPNTAYDRGRTQTNREEADAVARAVMRHAHTTPGLTLGVAAFSTAQMQAIIDKLEVLRREDPSAEPFFSDHPHEPFFVKNLETVQGDERAVIFISIGYGRTADGYFAMNFGPLNREGGERRLNVLITRARLRCEVFTNLTADDIDLERSSARGVRALKQFLHFARSGKLDIPLATGRQPDSPFEEAVMMSLREQGYEVRPQVGSAGFFIDIGVLDKEHPGRYLLGIECDGATYHSARSARDRDRLRQYILEGLGWKIHRIWSTDWFRDPQRELKRAVAAIETARVSQGAAAAVSSDPATERKSTVIKRNDEEKRQARSEQLPKYVASKLNVRTFGMRLDELGATLLSDYVVDVVRVEGPVHIYEVCRRIADGAGVRRIGSRIQDTLNRACAHAVATQGLHLSGNFLWPSKESKAVLRSRAGVMGVSPKFEMIAPEEIALAVERVVVDGHGVDEENVYLAACQLFGYARVGEEMRQRLSEVIERMVAQKVLARQGSRLVTGRREM